MEGWKFWWGIAAFFLGGLATQLNGWLTYRRQRKDRADDAQDALRQRREEFELQHLVEVHQLLRDCLKTVLVLEVQWRRLSEVPHEEVDEAAEEVDDLRMAFEEAWGSLHAQVGFIFDDQVRLLVNAASAAIHQLRWVRTAPREEAMQATTEVELVMSRRVRRV